MLESVQLIAWKSIQNHSPMWVLTYTWLIWSHLVCQVGTLNCYAAILYYKIQSVCVSVCMSVRNRLPNYAHYDVEAFTYFKVLLEQNRPWCQKYCLHRKQVLCYSWLKCKQVLLNRGLLERWSRLLERSLYY